MILVYKMNMKRFIIILILLSSSFFLACGVGNSTRRTPEHLSVGMQAIAKGVAQYNQGCYQQALESFFRAHERFSASDQLGGVATSLNNIGNVYRFIGDRESAVLFFNEASNIYTDINDPAGVVQVLSNKSALLIEDGRYKEAEDILNTAENLARQKGISYVPLLKNLGILYTRTKDYDRAEKILKSAFAKTSPENLSSFAAVNYAFGKLMTATQHYEKALAFFESALTADRSAGFYKGMADDLAAIGSVYMSMGKNEQAVIFFKRGIKIYALIRSEKNVRDLLEQIENISKKTGTDIRVTALFVRRWLEGQNLETLCK
jgi:tetratricopeptide (TPR) repeat protein